MTDTLAPPLRLAFVGSQGDTLAGRLESPLTVPTAYALFAHCFTCGKDAVAVTRIARALTDHGIAVLRFDFTGLGQSGGDFADTTFSSNIDDLVSAAAYLRENHRAPSLLVGHSLGGAAVLAAAHQIPEVRAVATIGAPADPRHVLGVIDERVPDIGSSGASRIDLGGRPFHIGREFLRDLETHHPLSSTDQLQAALLVMHSPSDRIVPIDHARRIFDAAQHPKSFVALDGADHLLSRRSDAEFAAGIIGAWASRYTVAPTGGEAGEPQRLSMVTPADAAAATAVADAADAAPPLDAGTVRVAESGRGPYGQTVTTAHHRLTADEPKPVGSDSGPSPYEFLLAALGACTSMTLRMYAERKKWPVGRIDVTLRHSRIHAQDCADCEARTGQVDHIDRSIAIAGPLTAEQHGALLKIADRCPVHRTLHGAVQVSTRLAAGDEAWELPEKTG